MKGLLLSLALIASCTELSKLNAKTIDLSGTGWSLWRDGQAAWENDELFLPPVDLSKVPTNAPTGGWQVLYQGIPVSVPGTAEEFLGKGLGPQEAVKGVTWWVKDVTIPSDTGSNKTTKKIIRLLFSAVRQRAEVFVNQKLVGYDIIGNTPFEADLTGIVKPGEKAQIAVRITNPGGNFSWQDGGCFKWGKYSIPMSHGFGGITGAVHLSVTDPIFITDLVVQNTPVPTKVNFLTTIQNTTGAQSSGSAEVVIREKKSGETIFHKTIPNLTFPSGETSFSWPLSVPEAKLWDLDHPNLYEALVTVKSGGISDTTPPTSFGFRWFAPEGIGTNAMLRLNGKRVILHTAISWGFWPDNGIFPSPQLAAREIETAKAYGMNMVNFHRCIGNPISMDTADNLGLFYFEEPGAYAAGGSSPFAQELCRQKFLRMVKRDRSHPSVIIFNMINENGGGFSAQNRRDMIDAHAIDPSRVLLFTSAWAGRARDPKNDVAKTNMQPFDDTIHTWGWWDYHRAPGPVVWKQQFYRDPENHYGLTKNREEIVYWGEEGAVSAPPRLQLIARELKNAPHLGWDGQVYLNWFQQFEDYLNANNLRGIFPTVDDFCKALGAVSIEHQGRKFEDARICDLNDGYAINGWESELIENHSGVVDCFRNPKSDPAIMAYYDQPLYVAVKPRQQIIAYPGSVTVDFYLLNEKNLHGPQTLKIRAADSSGKECFAKDLPFTATGGDVYGQLIAEAIQIPLTTAAGMNAITASVVDTQGKAQATGHDQILSVDWKSIPITGNGAVFENNHRVRDFLKKVKGIDAPLFDDTQGKLDWLVVAKSASKEAELIPEEALLSPDGKTPGLKASFFANEKETQPLFEHTVSTLRISLLEGETPDPHVPLANGYMVRWEGFLLPPVDGDYTLTLKTHEQCRIWLDNQLDYDGENLPRGVPSPKKDFKLKLSAGKPLPIRAEMLQRRDGAGLQLVWQTPIPEKITAAQVLDRAKRDGTKVLILDRASEWLRPIGTATGVPQGETFGIGTGWAGGQFFVKDHPLFAGLPVNQALNWPYQSVLAGDRKAFDLHGGELIAGAWQSMPMKLGTAVGTLPLGKGTLILSTLDIVSQLDNPDSSAEVARRLFCNFLNYTPKN